ncbi:uncharacterized protein Bfra_011650 [Botrytis fragariae]|uniref:BTB domain-containing protein n=1 Tax=Botrytis fragariae TaxID=1964551 RepID=A0A8H6AK61_9HELO|nr:uncharacterized protein Bfra_011650 [Botrytis fragariae]KAF5869107.1 hypothetical protein Bfra_011650 [Botrytis fragariae]
MNVSTYSGHQESELSQFSSLSLADLIKLVLSYCAIVAGLRRYKISLQIPRRVKFTFKMEGNKSTRMVIRSIGREVVHVKVGKDLQDFGVHKSLICHCSPFFKAAFTSGFEETATGIIKLADVDVEVFELFFRWLYTQQIGEPEQNAVGFALSDDESKSGHDYKFHVGTLLRLYIFADMIKVPTLKNGCIEKFSRMGSSEKEYLTESENVQYVWDHTREGDLIRKLFIHTIIWDLGITSFNKNLDQISEEVRLAILLAMKRVIDNARTEIKEMGKSRRKFKTLASLDSPLEDPTNYHEKVGEENKKDGDVSSKSRVEVSEEMYEVEEILDSEWVDGLVSYKAKWVGHKQDDQYYSAENFRGAQELVKEFHKKYPHKPHPGIKKTFVEC